MNEEIRNQARSMGHALRRFLTVWRARNATHLGNTTQRQYMALSLIDQLGECRMSELAEGLGVTMGAASNAANTLVKAGYVERTYDPTDRRLVKVTLTDAGSAEMLRIRQLMLDTIAGVLERMSVEDRESLLRTFCAFSQIAEGKLT